MIPAQLLQVAPQEQRAAEQLRVRSLLSDKDRKLREQQEALAEEQRKQEMAKLKEMERINREREEELRRKAEADKKAKEEQARILGRGGARPKLSFGIKL